MGIMVRLFRMTVDSTLDTKNKIIFCIIIILMSLGATILVSIPSHIYGISGWLSVPVAYLFRLFIDKPNITRVGIIAFKIRTIFVLLIIPLILYLYVWEPAGWIFFVWMTSYLLLRIYSGAHQQGLAWTQKWERMDAFLEQKKGYHIKYNPFITLVTIILNVATLLLGYQFGGIKGLYIGLAFCILIWLLSPFMKEIVLKKFDDDETTKIE